MRAAPLCGECCRIVYKELVLSCDVGPCAEDTDVGSLRDQPPPHGHLADPQIWDRMTRRLVYGSGLLVFLISELLLLSMHVQDAG